MAVRNTVRRVALSLHNWMGLIVGIQIVFWFVGGLVMTILPLDLVRGERSMAELAPVAVAVSDIARVLEANGIENARQVTARSVAGEAVLQVTNTAGDTNIYSIGTSALLSPISGELAADVALADFHSRLSEDKTTSVVAANWLTEEPGDFRRALPVWQVLLDDSDGTRIYVSPDTGRVLARRNDYWRVFDFFWMLHIMDYDERDDINNSLLIITTIAATLFVLTGLVLLYFRFWPGARRAGG